MTRLKFKIIILILLSAIFFPDTSSAVDFCSLNNYSVKIDEKTIKNGYTISAFKDNLRIGIFPDVLQSPTRISLKNLIKFKQETGEDYKAESNDGWLLNGDIYEYDIIQRSSYDQKLPLSIEIFFGKDTNNYKKVFYFNDVEKKWKEIPSVIDWQNKKIKFKSSFSYAKIAIFDQIGIDGRGKSSWYNQALFTGGNGDYAASQQYPRGTKLKVINLNNNKSVIVKINDYGPEKWTGRIIDLDVSAFKKLAHKSVGVINVSVEPVE